MTKKIYWDKGHGGTDPGAVGNGLLEKVLNHKIVEYGMAYLDANYSGHVQKTSRTGDQTLSLNQRTNDANAWGADILMSVHINSSANKAANGFETFIYNVNPGAPTIGFQNILHPEVYQVMKAYGINNDRGKKQGNLHMLRESKMIACLSENLFISNETDANRLKQEAFLKAVGEAHARGIAKFLGLPAKVVKKEESDMLEKAIVINSFPDMTFAEVLAAKLKAPIYTRAALPGGKVAKELYVVGGTTDGLQADKVISLSGSDRFAVAAAVKNFIG